LAGSIREHRNNGQPYQDLGDRQTAAVAGRVGERSAIWDRKRAGRMIEYVLTIVPVLPDFIGPIAE
jgi:hypothetical protein